MKLTREENKKLIEKYPFLLPRDRFTGEIEKDYDYSYTEIDALEQGWRVAFGDEMLEELREILIKNNCLDLYHIIQIKEKFGILRWYGEGATEQVSKELNAWKRKYEIKSAFTCIDCGKSATVVTTEYILPLCDACLKIEIKNNPNNSCYIPINEWYKDTNKE